MNSLCRMTYDIANANNGFHCIRKQNNPGAQQVRTCPAGRGADGGCARSGAGTAIPRRASNALGGAEGQTADGGARRSLGPGGGPAATHNLQLAGPAPGGNADPTRAGAGACVQQSTSGAGTP